MSQAKMIVTSTGTMFCTHCRYYFQATPQGGDLVALHHGSDAYGPNNAGFKWLDECPLVGKRFTYPGATEMDAVEVA